MPVALDLPRREPGRRRLHLERLVSAAPVGRPAGSELFCRLAHLRAGGAPHRLAGDRHRDLRRGRRAGRVARACRAGGDALLLGRPARAASPGPRQRRRGRERARGRARNRLPRADREGVGRQARCAGARAGGWWFRSCSRIATSPACAICPTWKAAARASASTSTRRARGARSAPVLLQIHGGGWTIGDKRQQALPLMMHLSRRGWICVAANYRLSPRATFPEHLIDVKQALRWVRENIAEYGGDPGFVAITGGSAGGHLCGAGGAHRRTAPSSSPASRRSTPPCRRRCRSTAPTTSPTRWATRWATGW